jgi:hypothetical protein
MIAEIPDPACAAGSGVGTTLARVRQEFVARFGEPNPERFERIRGAPTVRITGVLFFDVLHGQRGVAPNGADMKGVGSAGDQTAARGGRILEVHYPRQQEWCPAPPRAHKPVEPVRGCLEAPCGRGTSRRRAPASSSLEKASGGVIRAHGIAPLSSHQAQIRGQAHPESRSRSSREELVPPQYHP